MPGHRITTISSQTIGLAGCGAMGLPMARALLRAGFNVYGFDIRPVEQFGDFATRMMASAEDFSNATDVLISVVRDQRQTVDLYFDEQALFDHPNYPKTCLLASTLSPRFLDQLVARLPDDVLFIDIPMSGAPIAAVEERLSFMIGANEQTAAPIKPLLQAMGGDLHFLGGLGKGMTCKVLNNFVAASSVAAVRQVLSEAQKLGISAAQLRDVMKSSSGGTWFGDNFERIVWARQDYHPANTMAIIEKDVNALLDALAGGHTDPQALKYIETIRDRLSALPPAPHDSD